MSPEKLYPPRQSPLPEGVPPAEEPGDPSLDWEALRLRTELSPDELQRQQGLRATGLFLLGYLLFSIFEVISLAIWGDPQEATGQARFSSLSLNIRIILLVSAFLFFNRIAEKRNWHLLRSYRVSLHLFVIAVLLVWLVHIHLEGNSITLLTISIPAAAILVSWLLGAKEGWIYLIAGTSALIGLFALEKRGALSVLPLFSRSYEIPLHVFLDFQYIVVNMVIYTAMSILVLALLNRYQKDIQKRSFEMVRLTKKLEILATTDSLTQLLNRRTILGRLTRELARAQREGTPVVILLADVDRFKTINDTHGHAVGDTALQEVSSTLRSVFRPYDHVARIGGDEFLVVLPNMAVPGGIAAAERVREALSKHPIRLDSNRGIPVTLTFGCSAFDPASPKSPDHLLREADEALYLGKQQGRDRVFLAQKIRVDD